MSDLAQRMVTKQTDLYVCNQIDWPNGVSICSRRKASAVGTIRMQHVTLHSQADLLFSPREL